MITRRRRHEVSSPGDIPRKPRHRARHLIDLAEDDDGGEFGVRVRRDGGGVEEDAHGGKGGEGGEVSVGFGD